MKKITCIKCKHSILQLTANKYAGLCAPCYKKKRKEEDFKKFMSIPGCPACDSSRYTSFNWKEATSNVKSKLSKYLIYIKKSKAMKFGILYQCITCQSFWWLDTGNKIMHYIENNRIHLLEKWNEKKFILPNKLLKIALQIGETPEPSYGRFLDRKIIPCAITTLDGKKYDKAILTITQLPPISEPNDKVFFVDEIKEIEPSEFSLPLSVRKKTAAAVEIRMGFSPTVVQSKCRQKFVLDGITNFFEQGKIKGKDIELLNQADHFLTVDFQYSTEVKGIYYFYADTGNEPWNLSKCLKFSGHLRSYLGRIDI